MGYRAIDPSEIPALHPVAQIRDRWIELADASGIAPWDRFDPLDHPAVLPWVMLLRQDDPAEPGLLRYAICGDGCRQTFGFSYQGKMFGEDLPPEAVRERLNEFAVIRAGRGPLYSFTPLPVSDREFIDVYRGVFGFASAGHAVDRIFVVLAPTNVRLTARQSARTDMTAANHAQKMDRPRTG